MNADAAFFFSMLRRRLLLVVAIVGLFSAGAVALAMMLPPTYRATARLVMESAQIPGDLAASTVRTAAAEQIQLIEQRMMSRAHLIELASRLRIYEGRELEASAIVDDMRARTTLTISDGRDRATLISIGFDAPTPAQSAEVTNAFVTFILEENVALRTARAGQTADFFRVEVQRLSEELDLRSSRMLAFRLENRDALPENLPDLRARQSTAQQALFELRAEIDRLTGERDAYIARHAETGRTEVLVEDSFTPFLRRLNTLQQELDVVVAAGDGESQRARDLRGRIASVERSIAAQLRAEGSGAATLFDRQLAAADAEIARQTAEAERLEALLTELGEAIAQTLANAITLEALQRDHQTIRDQYTTAIDRAARAETGDLIETLSRGQRITVVEQAIAPTSPERPRRRLIVAGGVGFGMLLAGALVFLLERLNSAIRRPADLEATLGITPLGVVPYIDAPRRGRRASARAGAAVILLGLAAGAALALGLGGLPDLGNGV